MKLTVQKLPKRRLIEQQNFPFEFLSALAERESWRKELNRPIYHMHKWWAKRLGSIFRGILLGSALPENADLRQAFYEPHDFSEVRVFDPFMGSGTTIGEANKLGMTALGRDINPVACESVRIAFQPVDRQKLIHLFEQLAATVGCRIRTLYQTEDDQGTSCEVLYYFWVKYVDCPSCAANVDLFSNYIFAKNAYPKKKPEIQVYCPSCRGIFEANYHQKQVGCVHCGFVFDPRLGQAHGAKATCASCQRTFSIIEAIQTSGVPPSHRLFAKLVLMPNGKKRYLPATDKDRNDYAACERLLTEELNRGTLRLPATELLDGHNTRQVLNYNYRTWRDFFNARQLLALGWLHEAIAAFPENAERDALLLLFSGILEFNNLFATYKGEGTGAVRHMFSHHVLKPERTPIEANVWGTSKSSGSFSGLFKSRLLRAIDYNLAPFEIGLGAKRKVFGASKPMGVQPVARWGGLEAGIVSLSCGSSGNTNLPDRSLDLIVTDPPFFDNVHYSELADFFFAWQTLHPRGFINETATTTRHESEVQDVDASRFGTKLGLVFQECQRILKDDGLLVFTYHHSRPDGWMSLAEAIYDSGFSVVQAHPVKSELSVAAPKSQTKEPVLIDAILVCRKRERDKRAILSPDAAAKTAASVTTKQLRRFAEAGYKATKSDEFVLMSAQFFVALGPIASAKLAQSAYSQQKNRLQVLTEYLKGRIPDPQVSKSVKPVEMIQYPLPFD